MQFSSEQYTTISSSLLSDCSASRMVAKLIEPGMCFAWNAHSASAITRRKSSLRSNFCINSSLLIVFIPHSFLMPRDPTSPALLQLRRYFGKTPAAPAQEKKRSARHHRAAGIHPVQDGRTPQQGESPLS